METVTAKRQRCGKWASVSDFDSCELPSGHDGSCAYFAPKCGAVHPVADPLQLTCTLDWDHEGEHQATKVISWSD